MMNAQTKHKLTPHKKAVSGFVAAGLLLSVALINTDGQQAIASNEAECVKMLQNTEQPLNASQCATQQAREKELSWGNWLFGGSRSTQFHFLDLFELLFGGKDQPTQDYGSNRKVSL